MKKDEKINLLLKTSMAVMFVVGVLVFSYPFVVDAINNYADQQKIAHFQEQRKDTEQEQALKTQLEKRNEQLRTGSEIPGMGIVKDPFSEVAATATDPGAAYYEQRMIGAIYIPKIQVALPIFDETNDSLLEKGATVLQGTSFPVGGESTHSAITGHSGLPDKKIFTDLEDLAIGDQFYIEAAGEKLAYQIEQRQVVLPEAIEHLEIQPGRDLVTLVTCTPYMINSHRLLLTASRVPYPTAAAQKIQQTQNYHRQRLWLFVCGGLIFSGLFGFWLWRKRVLFAASRRAYTLRFFLIDGAEATAFQVFDHKGKTPLLLQGKPVIARSGENQEVCFASLPGSRYQVKPVADPTWPSLKTTIGKVSDHGFRLRGRRLVKSGRPCRYYLRKED